MPETPDTVQPVVPPTPAAPTPEAALTSPVTENITTQPIHTETGAQTPHPTLPHAMEVHDPTSHANEVDTTLADVGGKTVGPTAPMGNGSTVQLAPQPFSKRSLLNKLTDVISLSALRTQIFPPKESSTYSLVQKQFDTERKEHQPPLEERSQTS